MTFEETCAFLQENISTIETVVPSLGDVSGTLDLIIQKIKYAIEHDDISELSKKEISKINSLFSSYIKGLILLNFKFTEDTVKVSEVLSLLADNLSNIYATDAFFDSIGLIIRVLIQVENSLQAQLHVNTLLTVRLQDILMYRDDPLDVYLSRKYYNEYVDFLNRRKNHDSSYSLNNICREENTN